MSQDSLSDIVVVSVVGTFGAIITAIIAFFGGKGSASAQLQTTLNEGFRVMTEARAKEHKECQDKVIELTGNLKGLEQELSSLKEFLRRNGLDVPRPPKVDVIQILDSRKD